MNSAPVASRRQAEACSHLAVQDQVVVESAHSDHCNPALHRCCAVAPRLLVRVRLADSCLRVPRTDRWSTESDRSPPSKR